MSKLTPIQQVYEIIENYTVTEGINCLYQNKDRLLKEDEDNIVEAFVAGAPELNLPSEGHEYFNDKFKTNN